MCWRAVLHCTAMLVPCAPAILVAILVDVVSLTKSGADGLWTLTQVSCLPSLCWRSRCVSRHKCCAGGRSVVLNGHGELTNDRVDMPLVCNSKSALSLCWTTQARLLAPSATVMHE